MNNGMSNNNKEADELHPIPVEPEQAVQDEGEPVLTDEIRRYLLWMRGKGGRNSKGKPRPPGHGSYAAMVRWSKHYEKQEAEGGGE
jgi:hypothetical protein